MDKYGLIGFPLGHSFSKNYFNEKFENEGINAKYINFELPSIEGLAEVLDTNPELKGFNVTIPYKEKVISYLDSVSPEANAIGAVNVVKVDHKGNETVLTGYNSDVIGFTKSIEPPVGMYPHVDECPPLPYEAMDTHTLLYDLIYNPDETLFMKKGKEHGATVKNGLEMLLLQAFASWDFWHEEK